MLTWPQMDAKKVLEKFGWNEGQGLGKNSNGMPEPIKVVMKRDNGGVSMYIIVSLVIHHNIDATYAKQFGYYN